MSPSKSLEEKLFGGAVTPPSRVVSPSRTQKNTPRHQEVATVGRHNAKKEKQVRREEDAEKQIIKKEFDEERRRYEAKRA